MKSIRFKDFKSKEIQIILIGIGLSALFWILESAAHVFVFRDTTILYQVVFPHPHELWMRLTVVGMFTGFSICSKMMFRALRHAEEKTERINEELRQIFDTAADGMRVIDKNFKVVRANETFSRLSSMQKTDIIGRNCHEVLSGPFCHTKNCPLQLILKNGERIHYDTNKVCRDGTIIPCIVSAAPFRKPDGEIIGIVEDFKDISDRKRYEEELLQSRERIRDLAAHLQLVREEERKYIAREIHDELGQALTGLKMDTFWLNLRLPAERPELSEKSQSMITTIDRTIKAVKRISSELRPNLIDDLGLTAAIEWQAEEFSKKTGITCEVFSEPEDVILDQEYSIALFRIFQEILTNVARHAEAGRVEATLRKDLRMIELKVRDDGKGIETHQISDPGSYGLIGMRERAHSLGGNLTIEGSHNRGTAVAVTIPLTIPKTAYDSNPHCRRPFHSSGRS